MGHPHLFGWRVGHRPVAAGLDSKKWRGFLGMQAMYEAPPNTMKPRQVNLRVVWLDSRR